MPFLFRPVRVAPEKKNELVIQPYLLCQINLQIIKKVLLLLVMQVALWGNNKCWLAFTANKLSGKVFAKEIKQRSNLTAQAFQSETVLE